MRNKMTAWIVAIALFAGVLSCPAFAAGEFSIRNGITWGMSMEEVKRLEGKVTEDGEAIDESGNSSLYYPDDAASCFTADMQYYFYKDRLFMLKYRFWYYQNDLSEEQVGIYLKEALTSLYGEGRHASYEDLDRFLLLTDVTDTWLEDNPFERMLLWDLPEDTTLILLRQVDDIMLIYHRYDTALDLPEDGLYNTENM